MKRVFAIILAAVSVFTGAFALSACACKHENGTEEVVLEPTCTTVGKVEFTCSDCGKVITRDIPMIDHDYSVLVSDTATCTASGTATYRCSMCTAEITEPSVAQGHDFVGYFCTRCQKMEDGFNKFEFNGNMFDINNAYVNSYATFIVVLDATSGSSAVELNIYASGKRSGNVFWTVTVLNDTKKTLECTIICIGTLRYGSLKTFSKNSSMKNVYDPSDDYYIKITTTAL